MHTTFAGLEHLLFPELVQSPVVLTNARGVYSHSLAEFALLAAKWFAMDVPRLLRAKRERRWDQFEVEISVHGSMPGCARHAQPNRAVLLWLSCLLAPRAFPLQVEELRGKVMGIVG